MNNFFRPQLLRTAAASMRSVPLLQAAPKLKSICENALQHSRVCCCVLCMALSGYCFWGECVATLAGVLLRPMYGLVWLLFLGLGLRGQHLKQELNQVPLVYVAAVSG